MARLRKGLRQAVTYRQRWQLDLSHLVLFNAWGLAVDLPPAVSMEGGVLAIHNVDLGGPPSKRTGRRTGVSWGTDRVLKEALG